MAMQIIFFIFFFYQSLVYVEYLKPQVKCESSFRSCQLNAFLLAIMLLLTRHLEASGSLGWDFFSFLNAYLKEIQ